MKNALDNYYKYANMKRTHNTYSARFISVDNGETTGLIEFDVVRSDDWEVIIQQFIKDKNPIPGTYVFHHHTFDPHASNDTLCIAKGLSILKEFLNEL